MIIISWKSRPDLAYQVKDKGIKQKYEGKAGMVDNFSKPKAIAKA